MLDIQKITEILPHRYPFLMIDRIEELDPGKKVVALKNISINEGFFTGHFPAEPVMPGVLIAEAMAQASIILFYSGKPQGQGMNYYLYSVKVRFLHPVGPGDQLKIIIEPVKIISRAAIVKVQAFVGDKEVAAGQMSFSVKPI
jgi:3-hydroxyacyl-[acyl-carrier-protein] dehydratase